ncbi:MAG: COG3650 family protein [Saprospiraceae bacterium]
MSPTRLLFCALLAFCFQNCKNQPPTGAPAAQNMEKAAMEKAPRFACVGTEPFWHVKIEPDSGIIYNQMDEGITRYPYTLPRQEGAQTIFESAISGSNIKIIIEAGQCSDGMSDEVYPYASKVEKDKTVLTGCAK